MDTQIEMEWGQTQDITEYSSTLENLQMKLECRGISNEMCDMLPAAADQMQNNGFLDQKFIR